MLYGTGEVAGLSENSPPYRYNVSCEFHKYPLATGGGPDGCGRPCRAGEEICQLSVRSRVRKSLSARKSQCQVARVVQSDLLHVLLVWLACVLARPPYIYKVPLTMAVCCDHLVQMFTGLMSLPTSSSGSVLIFRPCEVFMVPAFAPTGPTLALK
jgi:hypothetical protein